MQRVAGARLIHDRAAMEHGNLYTQRLTTVLRDVAAAVPDMDHPLLTPRRKVKRRCVIAFSSDRGLCGAFNITLMQELQRIAGDWRQEDTDLVVVGKVLARRATRRGWHLERQLAQPSRRMRGPVLDELAGWATQSFLARRYDELHVLFSRFLTGLTQEAVLRQILPVSFPGGPVGGMVPAGFEPGAEEIMTKLLPEYVRQVIDNGFLNSLASENASRQIAMTRASENATDILRELKLSYSRLRQESITTEMLELIGGRPTGRR
jgi:F-type H+-transporting ATPase subunit gamma